MKHILHGIGKAVLRDFKEPSKVIAMTDMQDLSVESSFSTDDITGGNKLFPIASFKKDQSLKVSATNAVFDDGIMPYLDGADVTTGAVTLTDFVEVAIPEDGVVTLEQSPIANSVKVAGYTVASSTPTTGQYKADAKTVTFATADKGKVVTIVYDFKSSPKATEYSVTATSMSKPFIFDYIFPIYDEDTQITHKGYIKVYKAQCTSGFKLDAKHQEAFAPQFEAQARDAKRADGKLWSLFIDGVETA